VGHGKVEIQNQDSHFPTAPTCLRRKEKNGRLHKTLDAPGPDCNRPKRVCADSFHATPRLPFPGEQSFPRRRFRRHAESIGPMWTQTAHQKPGVGRRLPLVGPRAQSKGRDGRNNAPCSSSAMSSDRLFLDRVARQHCPSPLHRHWADYHAPLTVPGRRGHFYFAQKGDISILR
jgi:hypothetical protein